MIDALVTFVMWISGSAIHGPMIITVISAVLTVCVMVLIMTIATKFHDKYNGLLYIPAMILWFCVLFFGMSVGIGAGAKYSHNFRQCIQYKSYEVTTEMDVYVVWCKERNNITDPWPAISVKYVTSSPALHIGFIDELDLP